VTCGQPLNAVSHTVRAAIAPAPSAALPTRAFFHKLVVEGYR
jgi:hypothetical protein